MLTILDHENVLTIDSETAKEIGRILEQMPTLRLDKFIQNRTDIDEILKKKGLTFRTYFSFESIDDALELINPKLRTIALMQAIAEAHKRNDPTTDNLGIYILMCLFSFLEVMIRRIQEKS